MGRTRKPEGQVYLGFAVPCPVVAAPKQRLITHYHGEQAKAWETSRYSFCLFTVHELLILTSFVVSVSSYPWKGYRDPDGTNEFTSSTRPSGSLLSMVTTETEAPTTQPEHRNLKD